MPAKNKPKRLNRQRSWRVARRKKRANALVKGNSRNRKPRPKKKKAEIIVETKSVEKAVVKKAVKKTPKKE